MSELLFRDDAYLRQCEASVLAADERGILLDRTVFYPTGGGQPGDSGSLLLADGRTIAIADARKGEAADTVRHVPAPGSALPAPGSKLVASIDWDRRHRLMRMHTCLHLLSAVLPYPVTGGQVSDGKGRLDFDIAEMALDKEAIAERLNALIVEDHAVAARWISDEELAASPELVKTMSVRPPVGAGRVRLIEVSGLDLQACGGTHVARTGEIGAVIVRKIESKGRQNRRVALELA
ncbi:MAG TPA: alanyl-tRNA editing protein [Candidatus Sulfotelmatobacter sp.]|nr:alanyl-tRNA editing protein [Candidatus Sulfotelmatobacter sp.]